MDRMKLLYKGELKGYVYPDHIEFLKLDLNPDLNELIGSTSQDMDEDGNIQLVSTDAPVDLKKIELLKLGFKIIPE
jgi:hypothetical protein